MAANKWAQIVTKAWQVYESPEDQTKGKPKPISRKFNVKEAAEQFAELARKTHSRPSAIYVGSIQWLDGVDGLPVG